jgi:hypothetical protein
MATFYTRNEKGQYKVGDIVQVRERFAEVNGKEIKLPAHEREEIVLHGCQTNWSNGYSNGCGKVIYSRTSPHKVIEALENGIKTKSVRTK